MCDGGISVGREQRLVALTVVIEAQRDVTAHRVVRAERGFDGFVAACSFRQRSLDVARNGVLIT